MKIKVNSELLLQAAFGIPNVSSVDMVFNMSQGTHGLCRDFFAGREIEEVLEKECPKLLPVYNEVSEWRKRWPRPGLRYPQQMIKRHIKYVLIKHAAPEAVEMPAYRSIYAILTVLTGIEYFTGYELKETQRALQHYSGGVPLNLLPTVLKRDNNLPFAEMEYEIRSWYNNHRPPTVEEFGHMGIWKANFSDFIEQLIKRYDVPLYYKV